MFNTYVVETVHECVEGEWTYRFFQSKKGVYVKRTPSADSLWSHGIITQNYDIEQGRFISQCLSSGTGRFDSIFQAKLSIQKVLTT